MMHAHNACVIFCFKKKDIFMLHFCKNVIACKCVDNPPNVIMKVTKTVAICKSVNIVEIS